MSRGSDRDAYYALVDHAFLTHRTRMADQRATTSRSKPASLDSTAWHPASPQPNRQPALTPAADKARPQSAVMTGGGPARSMYQSSFKPPAAAAAAAATTATAAAAPPRQQQQQQPQLLTGYQGKMTGSLASLLKAHANSGKAEVGRAVWSHLHRAAAQLPDALALHQQQDVRQMTQLLGSAYPCPECAAHFREILRRDPPMVRSGPEYRGWLCRAHNAVNRSLGKPEFNCNMVVPSGGPGGAAGSWAAPTAGGVSGTWTAAPLDAGALGVRGQQPASGREQWPGGAAAAAGEPRAQLQASSSSGSGWMLKSQQQLPGELPGLLDGSRGRYEQEEVEEAGRPQLQSVGRVNWAGYTQQYQQYQQTGGRRRAGCARCNR